MSRRSALALAVVLAAPSAHAAERLGVLAVADPPGPDADLAELAHQLRAACRDRIGNVEDVPAMRARLLGDAGPASLAELDRAYGGALATYQNGEFESAVSTLRAIVEDLERLPEGPEAYAQWIRAMQRLAHAAATVGLDAEAEATYEKLARTEPDLEPDPDQYSPGYRRRFEAAKARVRALPRHRLRVDARGAEGTVYLNGKAMGVTPVELRLPPGRYRVGGAAGALRVPSFKLELGEDDRAATLDFSLAAAVRPNAGPGLALSGPERGAGLIRAGAWLGVDRLVTVARAEESGVQFLVGAIHDVRRGSLLREGSVRMVGGGVPAVSLGALAAFLLTGQSTRGVEDRTPQARALETVARSGLPREAAGPAPAPPAAASGPPPAGRALLAPARPAARVPAAMPEGRATAAWMRPTAIGAGAGALVLGALAVQQALVARGAREDANAMVGPGGELVAGSDPARFRDLVRRGDSAVRNAWVSAGLAAALSVTAAVVGWRSREPGPEMVALRF